MTIRDFLGQERSNELSSRYGSGASIEIIADAVDVLPCLTAHLNPAPIKLVSLKSRRRKLRA